MEARDWLLGPRQGKRRDLIEKKEKFLIRWTKNGRMCTFKEGAPRREALG